MSKFFLVLGLIAIISGSSVNGQYYNPNSYYPPVQYPVTERVPFFSGLIQKAGNAISKAGNAISNLVNKNPQQPYWQPQPNYWRSYVPQPPRQKPMAVAQTVQGFLWEGRGFKNTSIPVYKGLL